MVRIDGSNGFVQAVVPDLKSFMGGIGGFVERIIPCYPWIAFEVGS